jgi:type VI secretion system secreted protein VgrG
MDETRTAIRFNTDRLWPGAMAVARFIGHEALSTPFVFDLDLLATGDNPLDARTLVGGEGQLRLHSPGGERVVHGLIARADDLGNQDGRFRYGVRLVPGLWRLGLTKRCRLFQGQTVPEIVTAVLDGGHIRHQWRLRSDYPARELCVQYRESDLNFISRLLEAEGIFYFFEHDADDGHVLILGDAAHTLTAIDGDAELPFRERAHVADEDHVHAFTVDRSIVPERVVLGDFDFERPTMDMSGVAETDAGATLEHHVYPGNQSTPADGKRLASLRLEALRCDAEQATASTNCARIAPGATFSLEGHAHEPLNRSYLVVGAVHRGEQPDRLGVIDTGRLSYENTVSCIPAYVPYRPSCRTPIPSITGVQTAIVVGPAGEEIHTDHHGRVKVQFHWDREGSKDDRSSTWLRVGQAWAGAAWGAVFMPRVGSEAVVRFLEGNPDRPLIVGALYNGHQAPPVTLPAERTKSTLRSCTSPGGAGANELQFEDAAGHEFVLLHAHRDERVEVEADKDQTVGGAETLTVGKGRAIDVRGEQQLQVSLDDESSVDGHQVLNVAMERKVVVGGDDSESVTSHDKTDVLLAREVKVAAVGTEAIALGKMLSVGGAYLVDVGGAITQLVGGAKSTIVGAYLMEECVGLKREIVLKGNKTSKVSFGGATTEVEKDHRRGVEKDETFDIGSCYITTVKDGASQASQHIALHAEELGIVVDGQIAMIINKAGTLKIFGKDITLECSSGGTIKGKKVKRQGKGTSASKRLDDKLTPAEAATLRSGQGENDMLSSDDLKGFKDGKYTERVLKKDIVGYRLHHDGPGGYPLGKWVTKNRVPPGLEGKLRCALDPTWSNAATKIARVRIPAGTKVFEGAFASQSGAYVGQGQQLCVAVPKALKKEMIKSYLEGLGMAVLP